MIKALWFMVKVALLAALAVWVAERPGVVRLEWLDYRFTVHVGLFLLVSLLGVLLSIFIYNVIRTFVDFPKSYRRYLEIRQREKGYRALTLGLTAVAAGDTKIAVYQAHRVTKFLPEDRGLPLLLQAQAARLDGREEDARQSFIALLESPDAAFLGVRGLLQAALDMRNYPKALELAHQALKLHPKQKWILRIVYDLQIKLRDWAKARETLYRAEKAGAFLPDKARSDRVAMLLAEAEADMENNNRLAALEKAKKAIKYDPAFVPAVSLAARLYNQTGNRRKAVRLVEKIWAVNPHPEFIAIWDALAPAGQSKKPLERLNWLEKLLSINGDAPAGLIEAGRMAMEESLWGQARSYFTRAEALAPGASLYRHLAELEERSTKNEEAALAWLEKAAHAPPEKIWICSETGRIYERWHPIAPPHGAFNTIRWDLPQGVFYPALNDSQNLMAEALLEAPSLSRA